MCERCSVDVSQNIEYLSHEYIQKCCCCVLCPFFCRMPWCVKETVCLNVFETFFSCEYTFFLSFLRTTCIMPASGFFSRLVNSETQRDYFLDFFQELYFNKLDLYTTHLFPLFLFTHISSKNLVYRARNTRISFYFN